MSIKGFIVVTCTKIEGDSRVLINVDYISDVHTARPLGQDKQPYTAVTINGASHIPCKESYDEVSKLIAEAKS